MKASGFSLRDTIYSIFFALLSATVNLALLINESLPLQNNKLNIDLNIKIDLNGVSINSTPYAGNSPVLEQKKILTSFEDFNKSSTVGKYSSAAVVSNGKPCSGIGVDILKKGGNAIEAAIATLLCDGVTRFISMGVGGGFQMTIYERNSKTATTLIAREKAPFAAFKDMYRNESWASQIGARAAAVPGELMGYQTLFKKFRSGNIYWRELFEPTIRLCEEGITITEFIANAIKNSEKEIRVSETLSKLLLNEDGTILKVNDTMKRPHLARTLRVIAHSPRMADELYDGVLTKAFLRDIRNGGGIITAKDLASYRADWKKPVVARLEDGFTIFTLPPPGSGVIYSFIMKLLNDLIPVEDGQNILKDIIPVEDGQNIKDFQRIVEAFKHGYGRRSRLGSNMTPGVIKVLKELTSLKFIESIVANISETNHTSENYTYYGGDYVVKNDHGTGNINVLAPNGDAVSVTSSINTVFGSYFISKSTGILLNNHMDDFSSEYPNSFNIPPSPENFIEPGKRPMSSMSSSIIVDKYGDTRLLIGSAGGPKIISSVAFVSALNLWFGKKINLAVDEPRVHHQLLPMVLMHERNVDEEILQGMKKFGHKLTPIDFEDSSCVTAISQEDGEIVATADFRWDGGSVAGF